MSTADFQMEERCELIVSAYVLGEDVIIKTDGTCGVIGRIVRCRDCRHMEPRTFNDPITETDFGWFRCDYFNRPTKCDGFCAWGDRRDA